MLFILIGIPGSGKSTIAKQISTHICEADLFPGLYREGKIQSHLLKNAHEDCMKKTEEFMLQWAETIVVANTNLDSKSILVYVELALRYSYKVQMVLPKYNLLHYEVQQPRLEFQMNHIVQLRSIGEKIVPLDAIERMTNQFMWIEKKIRPFEKETDPSFWKQYLK